MESLSIIFTSSTIENSKSDYPPAAEWLKKVTEVWGNLEGAYQMTHICIKRTTMPPPPKNSGSKIL